MQTDRIILRGYDQYLRGIDAELPNELGQTVGINHALRNMENIEKNCHRFHQGISYMMKDANRVSKGLR